jgi:hypothetical protein
MTVRARHPEGNTAPGPGPRSGPDRARPLLSQRTCLIVIAALVIGTVAAATSLPVVLPHGSCQASQPCTVPPCFHVRLDARARPRAVHREAAACPRHVGEVVCRLTAWAHEQGLTCGQVTVLAIDRSAALLPPAAARGFPFGSIPL